MAKCSQVPRNGVQLGTAVDCGECAPAAPAYDANRPFTRIQKGLSVPSMCAEEPPLGFSVEPPHPGLSTFLCQVPREPAALAFLALASGEGGPRARPSLRVSEQCPLPVGLPASLPPLLSGPVEGPPSLL